MQSGLSFVDFLFLALVAVFVVSRFWNLKLPKDKNINKPRADRVIDFPKAMAATESVKTSSSKKPEEPLSPAEVLKQADPSFQMATFIKGAETAYAYYYDAMDDKDENTLAALLAPRLFDETMEKIENKTKVYRFDKMTTTTIVDAKIHGRTALVQVKFDASHKNGGKKKRQSSVWTFARSLNNQDPNWEIQDITLAN